MQTSTKFLLMSVAILVIVINLASLLWLFVYFPSRQTCRPTVKHTKVLESPEKSQNTQNNYMLQMELIKLEIESKKYDITIEEKKIQRIPLDTIYEQTQVEKIKHQTILEQVQLEKMKFQKENPQQKINSRSARTNFTAAEIEENILPIAARNDAKKHEFTKETGSSTEKRFLTADEIEDSIFGLSSST